MSQRKSDPPSSAINAWCQAPSRDQVYRAAQSYVAAGLSLIPIRADGSKNPAFELLPKEWCEVERRFKPRWSVLGRRLPLSLELKDWFGTVWNDDCGMAILGGRISGGLEIIDLDNAEVADEWCRLVEKRLPGLLKKLVRVQTPRPGMHVYYRCRECGGNEKLAREPEADPKTGKLKPKTLIETKGEGGYCLAPPSPGGCHKSGKCYQFLDGKDLTMVIRIKPNIRAILLELAKSLNTWSDPHPVIAQHQPRTFAGPSGSGRPGDDFNARASWNDVLEPYGWQRVSVQSDGSEKWCRPDKSGGTSATVNYDGCGLLFVFSTNASPFEELCAYSKFTAYALLAHDGNYEAAAKALAKQGFGSPGTRRRRTRGTQLSHYSRSPARSKRIRR